MNEPVLTNALHWRLWLEWLALALLVALAFWQTRRLLPALRRWWQHWRLGHGLKVSVDETRSLLFTVLLWVAVLRLGINGIS